MEQREKRFEFIPFIINMAIPIFFGAVASYIALRPSKEWLDHTNFNELIPDQAILGPLRTGLRVFIGISAFMIWRRRKSIANYKKIIIVYFTSPTLTLIWTYLFFRLHLVAPSLFVVSAAIIVAIYNSILFFRISKLAAVYLLPFLFWLLYLGYVVVNVYLYQ